MALSKIDGTNFIDPTIPVASGGTGAITLAAAGITNTPNFFAFLNADQTISSNTTTKVAYNDESWDTASAFDSSTNYRFTVPAGEAGKYNFTAQLLLYDANGQLGGIRPMIYKNGSMVSEGLWDVEFNASGYYWYNYSSNINITLNLSAADYIEVFLKGYTKDSGTFVIDGHASDLYAYFQGHKMIGA
tara:strand:+ start:556 stop:1119 length:564 start_codon:yes stop_codon:yes gene_type:complete